MVDIDFQEDPMNEWSKQTRVFPFSMWADADECGQMSFPGINKAGEIVMAPSSFARNVQPLLHFLLQCWKKKNIRRVRNG